MSVPSPGDLIIFGRSITSEPCSNAHRHARSTTRRMHLLHPPCFPAQGRVKGLPRCRVLQKGCRSAGCASREQISPRSLPTECGTDRQTRSGGSTSPATPTLCLRVKRAETAIASSMPELSRSAFLSDIHPSRGEEMQKEELQCRLSSRHFAS